MAVDLSLRDAKLGDVDGDLTVDADAPGLRARGHGATSSTSTSGR